MATPERIELKGSNLTLVGDALGPEDGDVILFLHGSGQTRQSWGKALKAAAAQGYRAITLDMRGHGDSEWAPDGRYEIRAFADDLVKVLTQLPSAPVLVGASLGGLVSLLVASEAPETVAAIVLVDITTRPEMSGAMEVINFMESATDGFASLEEAADAVAAYLPHRPRPKDVSGLQKNLRERNGRWYWHWDPAFLKMGEKAKQGEKPEIDLDERARVLSVPTLLLRGGRSAIVSEKSVKEFLELAPHTEYVDIAGAHHMVAGDANDAFNDAVFAFADKVTGRDRA